MSSFLDSQEANPPNRWYEPSLLLIGATIALIGTLAVKFVGGMLAGKKVK